MLWRIETSVTWDNVHHSSHGLFPLCCSDIKTTSKMFFFFNKQHSNVNRYLKYWKFKTMNDHYFLILMSHLKLCLYLFWPVLVRSLNFHCSRKLVHRLHEGRAFQILYLLLPCSSIPCPHMNKNNGSLIPAILCMGILRDPSQSTENEDSLYTM